MAMAGMKVVVVMVLAMAAMCVAREWEVDWKIPAAENTYAAFQQKPLNVGDTLKFTYLQEMHNVVEVGSVDDYEKCTATKPLSPEFTDGNTSMKLSKAGFHYYICTVPMHCAGGMKLKVQAANHHHEG